MEGHTGAVFAACVLHHDGETLPASGGDDDTVRIWHPPSSDQQAAPKRHTNWVNAVCVFHTRRGRRLLASGGDENVIRVWDPATGTQAGALDGHTDWVHAVCAFTHGGHTLLASGGSDETVRIWDPATQAPLLVIPVHHQTKSLAYSSGTLVVALTEGILTLELNPGLSDG